MRIAILGAGSHIAKNIIYHHSIFGDRCSFDLFTREPDRCEEFMARSVRKGFNDIQYRITNSYANLNGQNYDAIINCVGVGRIRGNYFNYSQYFEVYEYYDNFVIEYLKKNRKCKYISLSSGSVYGCSFDDPVIDNANCTLSVNYLDRTKYFSVAKIYSEAKHRSYEHLQIVDLRVFGFFSRFYNPSDGYLVNQLAEAARNNHKFVTDKYDIYRDYVDPIDLVDVIYKILDRSDHINMSIDICSSEAVSKMRLVQYFVDKYGVDVEYLNQCRERSSTGDKQHYYSVRPRPFFLHKPSISSLEVVEREFMCIYK